MHNYVTNACVEALVLAQDQFKPLCGSWDYTDWDEIDYSKIKELHFRQMAEKRRQEAQVATGRSCLKCPSFLKHVSDECLSITTELTLAVRNGAR